MLKLFLVIAAFLFIPSTAFCQPSSDTPLDVGIIVPLTGPLAEYGQAFKNGINLAKVDHKAVSNNCRFILEDSRYESKTAVSSFRKLVNVDETPVVYTWGGAPSESVAAIADSSAASVFVWSADPKVSQGRERVFRFCNSGKDYGTVLLEHLLRREFKKVGIVKTENQYIDAILSGLQKASEGKLEVEIIDSFQPSERDFRASITKLKPRPYDALGVFLLSGQVALFSNQLKEQAAMKPLFGTDFFESMTEVKQSNGALVDSVFANNQVQPSFRKSYVKKFGNDLQINHAANGYDFAVFMCEKIKPLLKEQTGAEIARHTQQIKSFAGKQGEARFYTDTKGDKAFPFPVVIRRIEEDKIVTEG